MSKPAVYWIIWGPAGKTNPTVRFSSPKAASKVAKRMALQHDAEFVVMQAIESVVPAPKTVSTFFDDVYKSKIGTFFTIRGEDI